jgi:hypothetical protein
MAMGLIFRLTHDKYVKKAPGCPVFNDQESMRER